MNLYTLCSYIYKHNVLAYRHLHKTHMHDINEHYYNLIKGGSKRRMYSVEGN